MDELAVDDSTGKPNRTRVRVTLAAGASCRAFRRRFHRLQRLGLFERQSGLPKIRGGLLRKPHLGGTAAIAPQPAFDA